MADERIIDTMTVDEIIALMRELMAKRSTAISAVIEPARAAANAMADAGMKNSVRPLQEALFAYDAIDSQIKALAWEKNAPDAAFAMLERGLRDRGGA
jgi:hypothetical protein